MEADPKKKSQEITTVKMTKEIRQLAKVQAAMRGMYLKQYLQFLVEQDTKELEKEQEK